MSAILVLSILIRILAFVGSVLILWRMKDWRFGFLSVMIALMAVRQILTLFKGEQSPFISFSANPEELPGLMVSILVFFAVFFLEQVLTRQKRVEGELRSGNRYYQALFDQGAVGVAQMDSQTGRFKKINQRFCDLVGYTREEMLDLDFQTITHPDDLQEDLDKMEMLRTGRLESFNMEKRYFKKDGSLVWVALTVLPMWPDKNPPDFHLAIVEDITARKLAEGVVRENEERLRLAVGAAKVGLFDWDIRTNRVHYSPEWKRQIGFEEEEISDDFEEWRSRVHPEDLERMTERVSAYVRSPWTDYEEEFRFRHKDGSYRSILTQASIINDEKGKPLRMLGLHVDITERKQAEEALRESQRVHSTLMSNLPGMVYRCLNDKEWTVVFASEGCLKLTGYPPSDLIQKKVSFGQDIIHPDDQDSVWKEVQAALNEKRPFQLTYRILTADKREKWVFEQGMGIFSRDGKLTALEGFISDDTERKTAEIALRRSEALMREIGANTPEFVLVRDVKSGKILYINKAWERISGQRVSVGENYQKLFEAVHPEDINRVRKAAGENPLGGLDETLRIRHVQGEERWVHIRTYPIQDARGETYRVAAIGEDITRRKEAEDRLRESEKKFRVFVENSPDVIMTVDRDTRITFINYTLPQYTVSSVLGKRAVEFLSEEDGKLYMRKIREVFETGNPRELVVNAAGPTVWLTRLVPMKKADRVESVMVIATNITEGKRAEDALRNSEERFRGSFKNAAVGMGVVDLSGRFVEVNQALCDITGYSERELKGLTFQDITHPDDREKNIHLQKNLREGQKKGYVLEKRYIRKDGKIVWGKVSVGSIYNSEGGLINTVGLVENITEQKRAEKGLVQFKSALDQTLDCVFMFNPVSLKFVYANRGAMEQVGYSESELFEMTPLDIKPEFTSESFGLLVQGLKDGTRDVLHFETIHRHKDGHDIPVDIVLQLVKLGEGEERFVAIVRDITEQKRQAAQIQSSLREKEVLLNEIHHRSKNNLQIISSLFSLQGDRTKSPSARRVFREGRERIQALALVHEKLYQSNDLARINFSDYVRELAISVYRSYNTDQDRICLKTEMDTEVAVDINSAIPCGLIINELLSNSLKYAFQKGKKGEMGVRLSQNNGNLEFTVWDDGVGLPPHFEIGKTTTLGLALVDALVRQTGGSLEIDREKKGTAFRIKIPMVQ